MPGSWNRLIRALPGVGEGSRDQPLARMDHYLDKLRYYAPRSLPNLRRLYAYRNEYSGERCWVFGNGPSLNDTPLKRLEDEVTFGLNRIYLKFDEMGYETDFLVSVNRLVSEQFAREIEVAESTKFIAWNNRWQYDAEFGDRDLMYVRTRSGPEFCTNIPLQGVWEGATVTYVALQLAYYMGFEKVVLVGVDHSFETEGEPHREIVSDSHDPNHFDPEYFGEDVRWQLPDLQTSEFAYDLARRRYEEDGRRIVDATIGGELEVFPKVDFEEVI